MSEIRRYVLVDDEDLEDEYEYSSLDEAKGEAIRRGGMPTSGSHHGYAIVERVYVYDDSSLVWTPNGDDTWPPGK